MITLTYPTPFHVRKEAYPISEILGFFFFGILNDVGSQKTCKTRCNSPLLQPSRIVGLMWLITGSIVMLSWTLLISSSAAQKAQHSITVSLHRGVFFHIVTVAYSSECYLECYHCSYTHIVCRRRWFDRIFASFANRSDYNGCSVRRVRRIAKSVC